MCSTWRLIYNAWNLVLMIDLLQYVGQRSSKRGSLVGPRRLQSTVSQGKNFLPRTGSSDMEGHYYTTCRNFKAFGALFQSAWLAKVKNHQIAPSGPPRAGPQAGCFRLQ